MAARLAHRNVVAVFDAGEDDGRPYIVMEYVPGETLADRLAREGRLEVDRAIDVGLQACAGLDHAHSLGLVHRDVKPHNLLLSTDGAVKIADFGIARAAEATRLTEIGTILGTAAYLSPEQAAGREVTPAADIYSLGVVLYEALAGRPPHVFQSLADLVARHADEVITPIREFEPAVPDAVESAVMRCLAPDPPERPASASELARELAGASAEAPTVPLHGDEPAAPEAATRPLARSTSVTRPLTHEQAAGAVTTPLRRAPTSRTRSLWLALAAVGVLAAIALVVALAARGTGTSEPAGERAGGEIPRGTTPAEQARNLARWLRENSG